ncbi:glutamine-hydrolyzing carbamoyl-phosphate synthase small subunit [soil metagenome]
MLILLDEQAPGQQPARHGALVLADGSVFEGELIGCELPAANSGIASGEVVFNTVMSGYQEVITDPSYAGQIITFTYPHIGNYGTNEFDRESSRPFCRGVIVREMTRRPSNHRSEASLHEMLRHFGICGIAGIDTRRLTRVLRDTGAMPGAFGTASQAELLAAARNEPGTDGIDLVAAVSTSERYTVPTISSAKTERRIVAFDFGIKATMLRHLSQLGTVEVVPAATSAADVLAMAPDGIFLSNGPGDPAMVGYAVDTIRDLLGQVPIFGICLGHQLLCRALGGETFKLPFGHHGGNHPVRHEATGRVEITSQNHNFCVDPLSMRGIAEPTHLNLYDNTNEGIRVLNAPAFSVQYHPEAGPGPHDSRYLFDTFAQLMDAS